MNGIKGGGRARGKRRGESKVNKWKGGGRGEGCYRKRGEQETGEDKNGENNFPVRTKLKNKIQ